LKEKADSRGSWPDAILYSEVEDPLLKIVLVVLQICATIVPLMIKA